MPINLGCVWFVLSLFMQVCIYFIPFRKLGNWKPREVYNQTSTNIQAVHIQLLTLLGPTCTLWTPRANIMLMITAQQK